MGCSCLDIAKMIGHSLLNPTLTEQEMEADCRLAVRYDAVLDALLGVRAIGVSRSGATRTAEMLDECARRVGAAPVEQHR
jgi:deoxyribose-phosphate aldolase